jgi:hypothetical protein
MTKPVPGCILRTILQADKQIVTLSQFCGLTTFEETAPFKFPLYGCELQCLVA